MNMFNYDDVAMVLKHTIDVIETNQDENTRLLQMEIMDVYIEKLLDVKIHQVEV